jgi:hypothetical protein
MNLRREIGLLRLLGLAMVGAVAIAAAGCDDGCLEGVPCIDIDAIRGSRVGVSLSPDGAGNEQVGVGIDLPAPVQPGNCYRLADDLDIRANGSTGEGVDLRADAGDDHAFYGRCAGEGQFLRTWFTVSAAPELLTITFSKDGEQVTVDIQRPQPQPVDVVLQDTVLDPASTFTAELQPQGGELPAGDCWSVTIEWGRGGVDRPLAQAEATAPGVRLTISFPEGQVVPPGPARLAIRSRVGDGCEPPPTVSCPGIRDCIVSQDPGRLLGPFDIQVL